MPLINLSVKHGRTLDDARGRLEMAVTDARAKFGLLVQRVEWADDRNSVRMSGTGFSADMRVDENEVHVSVDVPILGRLLGNPVQAGLKGIVQKAFGKPPQK